MADTTGTNDTNQTEVAQAVSGAEGQPIGTVDTTNGSVVATRIDGTKVELEPGSAVYQGDVIETAGGGSIGVTLADQTTFSMAENGEMVLDEMVYDPATQEGAISISAVEGVFTFVSGQIAKTDPDAMTLDTPVATIGIRGTQVGLDVGEGQDTSVLLMEEADGFVGEVVVSNAAGVQILNTAFQGTQISSATTAPVESFTVDKSQMLQQFGGALQHLPQGHNANTYGAESADIGQLVEQAQAEEGAAASEEELAAEADPKTEEELAAEADAKTEEELAAEADAKTEEELAAEAGDGEEDLAVEDLAVAQLSDEELAAFDTAAGAEEELAQAEADISTTEEDLATEQLGTEELASEGVFEEELAAANDQVDIQDMGDVASLESVDGIANFETAAGGIQEEELSVAVASSDEALSAADQAALDGTDLANFETAAGGEDTTGQTGFIASTGTTYTGTEAVQSEEIKDNLGTGGTGGGGNSGSSGSSGREDGIVTATNTAPTASTVTGGAAEDGLAQTFSFGGADVDGDALTYTVDQPTEGAVTNNADGTFSFDPGSDFQDLGVGQTRDVTFNYTVSDGAGGTATNTATVTITGTNDTPTITGGTAGDVVEDGTLTTGGQLNIVDADAGESVFTAQTGTAGTHGTFSVDADGTWNYTADNASIQSLGEGVTAVETFNVVSADGTSTPVQVTITGTNDAPTITGSAAGDVLDGGTLTTGGQLYITDVDAGEDVFTPQTATAGTHGNFSVDADGTWSFTADSASVQALGAGQTATDTFNVVSADGTVTPVTVTLTGTNDMPTITGGTAGDVVEDGTLTTGGQLNIVDADAGQSVFNVQTGTAGTHGTFNVDADGTWNYTADNSTLQSLGAGATAIETFNVVSADGTITPVTVTITGTNDVPTITGAAAGDVFEDGSLTTGGQLNIVDADAGESTVAPQTGTAGTHGTFSVDADGTWSYTADNASIQSLGAGVTATETFNVVSADGTATETITVTITGTNDVPTITGSASGDVFEDGSLTTGGQLNIVDADAGESVFTAQTGTAGTHGTFSVDADGTWSYTADNASIQSLGAGVTAVETFNVISADGTSTPVQVTITGTNDAPTITGGTAGDVVEDGTLTTGGQLAITDVDAGENVFRAQTGTAGTHGSFSVDADGTWSYTADNTSIQSLAAGETATETFNVISADGTSTPVTVTITGSNDAPTLTGSAGLDNLSSAADGTITLTLADLLAGYTDADTNNTLSVTNLTINSVLLVANLDGSFTFTPDANYDGTMNINYDVTDGTASTPASKTVTVSVTPPSETIVLSGDHDDDVTVTTGAGDDSITLSGDYDDSVTINGGAGNDTIALSGEYDDDADVTVSGGDGNDSIKLHGEYDDDVTVNGGAGDDNIHLHGDFDDDVTVTGGAGNDTIKLKGDYDDDVSVDGGEGDDTITLAGEFDDDVTVTGGAGDDTIKLTGDFDDDADIDISGGAGDDTITVSGDFDDDADVDVSGGDGNDTITVTGEFDDDADISLSGGAGDDTLTGGAGDDTLDGGTGDDNLWGGDGNDTFVFHAGDGSDTINDFGVGDTMEFEGTWFDQGTVTQDGDDAVVTFGSGSTDQVQVKVKGADADTLRVEHNDDGGYSVTQHHTDTSGSGDIQGS